ncbi:MAG: hypothetical protein IPP88_04910 [Betaproteobacteria bacterium]|nr:hypothetical protein [Betaproteobacteria bacterium]
MTISQIRRKNLSFIVSNYGTETEVGRQLKTSHLTQQHISALLNKRYMRGDEARIIETKLGIPNGWMDQLGWVNAGWPLIERVRLLDANAKSLINEVVTFMHSRYPNPKSQPSS